MSQETVRFYCVSVMYDICVHQVADYVDGSGAVTSGAVTSGAVTGGAAMATTTADQVGLSVLAFKVYIVIYSQQCTRWWCRRKLSCSNNDLLVDWSKHKVHIVFASLKRLLFEIGCIFLILLCLFNFICTQFSLGYR